MLPQKIRLELLFDFYGALLTEKQRRALELHWDADLSLAEVAEYLDVSRQAVYYAVKSAQKALERYEEKLNLVSQFQRQQEQLADILERLARVEESVAGSETGRELRAIHERLTAIIDT